MNIEMDRFKGKYVLVLGLAKSGIAAAKILHRLGAWVIVNEKKERSECSGVEELEALGIEVICGGHPASLLASAPVMVVKNPGIPYDIPFLQMAEQAQIPVVTEVEIAYLISKAPIIGITGSNGKTTTTTLIYEMLKGGSHPPRIAGNIGTVMCEVAELAKASEWIVAELSSFQLLGTRSFKPRISVLLNLFDAHLDYHHTKEHYVSSKAKLFQNQTQAELAILNYDQPLIREISQDVAARKAWFSLVEEVPRGTYVQEDIIWYKDGQGVLLEILDSKEVQLMGEHNLQNMLAAITVAIEAGAAIDSIRLVLKSFSGVEHRLQFVSELNGVRYYNDSKATNSLATLKAIQAFDAPIILIAGGLDRGEDFQDLQESFADKVKGIIVYGEISSKISKIAEVAGVKVIIHVDNVREAVQSAAQVADHGEVVLLSPAAASWDQFRSFEERGDMFTDSVHKLR